jgi:hypothetical protein
MPDQEPNGAGQDGDDDDALNHVPPSVRAASSIF